MGSNKTPNTIRGFLIPHVMSSQNIWTAESTYNNTATQPSQPTPAGDYDLGLTAAGTHDTSDTIKIQTQRAGHIGNAAFVWKEEGETDFYGYDAPNNISFWQSIIDGNTSSLIDYILLDALGLENGNSCIIYQERNATINRRTIRIAIRDRNGSITTTTLYYQAASGNPTLYGALTTLADGSILAVYATSTADAANLESARSYDNGTTWYVQAKTLLAEDIDLTGSFGAGNTGYDHIERIRIAESRGEILLIISAIAHNTTPASTNLVLQYVSTDNGCTFQPVAVAGGTFAYYRPDIIVKNNMFYVGYIAGTGLAEIVELESATISLDIAKLFSPPEITDQLVAGGLTQGHFTIGELSLWTNETGRIYAALFDADTQERFFILQSDDLTTWYYLGGNPSTNKVAAAQIYNIDDNQSRPTWIAGCNARGVNQIFHNYDTRTHGRDNGIHCIDLGGWATVNMPKVVDFPNSFDFGGWDRTWIPYDTPDATAEYTAFGTGTTTAYAEYCQFRNSIGNNKYVRSAAITTSSSEGIILRTRLRAAAQGHSLSGRGVNITTTNNEVSIWISLTGINVYDEEGSSSKGSLAFDTTEQFEILAALANNTIAVWVKTNADIPSNKRWQQVCNTSVASSASNPTQHVIFGHITATTGATGDTITYWYETHFAFGSRTGVQLHSQSNPEDLNARQYSPKGKYVYITDGIKISTFDGPAYLGESYNILPDSEYPIRRIFHRTSPTPRQFWRSADTTAQTIALFWDTTTGAAANTNIGSDSIGLYLGNINFASFTWDIYDQSTASWTTIGTITNGIGPAQYTRTGNAIQATNYSPTGTGEYLQIDQCKGYSFDFGTGIVRKIAGNTAGYLNNSTASKRAVLFLENFDNTDPTTITAGKIIPTNVCFVKHLAGATPGAAMRINISSQNTADGFFKIGAFLAGPLIAPQQYSNGRTITYTPGIETSETQDGVIRTRKVHDGYRQVRIAWTTGIDMSEIYDTTIGADYYTGTSAAGALPISNPADTPQTILGMVRRLDGETDPIVYIPALPYTVKTTYVLNGRDEILYGTIQGEISIEHVIGEENDTEVFRISTMNIREII